MATLRYISHPNVVVDPAVPVPAWSLSEQGRRRAVAMLAQPWVRSVTRIVSSGERKALETASVLADHLGLDVEVRPGTGEIDRTSTGFVPPERHDALADRCFAHPTEAAAGWETAEHAQRRIVAAVADLLVDDGSDVAIIGHGGVGTLLWCHLSGTGIARHHDQPGQGHHWAYDRAAARMVHGWRPIDAVEMGTVAPGRRRERPGNAEEQERPMEFTYRTESDLPYEQAIERVTATLGEQGFGVLTRIDMRQTLQDKIGVDTPPQMILGACNPQLAHQATSADPRIAALLPCNVVVRTEGGRTVIEALAPTLMAEVSGNEAIRPIAEDAARRIEAALDAARTDA